MHLLMKHLLCKTLDSVGLYNLRRTEKRRLTFIDEIVFYFKKISLRYRATEKTEKETDLHHLNRLVVPNPRTILTGTSDATQRVVPSNSGK